MKVADIACRAQAYGIPGVAVDGNNVEAVYAVVSKAVARARAGDGPTLIEAKTLRMQGHAIHDGFEYVPRELLAFWEERDPLRQWAETLLRARAATEDELASIRVRCEEEIAAALAEAEGSPLPDPQTVTEGVYAV
jgi:pyruvate dehydrogenase E1 component alpha subunit